jgi:hypothetical protein
MERLYKGDINQLPSVTEHQNRVKPTVSYANAKEMRSL